MFKFRNFVLVFVLAVTLLTACSGQNNAVSIATVLPTSASVVPPNCNPALDPIAGNGFCAIWLHWDTSIPLTYKDGHKIYFDAKSSSLKMEDPFAGSWSVPLNLREDQVMIPLFSNKEKTKIWGPILIRVRNGVFETEEYLLHFGEREYIFPTGPQS